MAWMDDVDRVLQLSLNWANSRRKRDMVRAHTDLVYINPTPSFVGGGTPPHIINKVLTNKYLVYNKYLLDTAKNVVNL